MSVSTESCSALPAVSSDSRILALDALRQLAAFVVLLHHFFIVFDIGLPAFLSSGLLDAKAAVILFFVLSGYVLTLSLRRETASFSGYVDFGIRRALRLYPMHIAATFLAFTVLVWISRNGGLSKPLDDPIGFLQSQKLNLQQWVLQLTLILPGMDSSFANPPVWTLMTEAKVSIVFPILAWTVLRFSLRCACAVVGVLILGSDWFDRNLVGTVALLGHFGLGALIARLDRNSFCHFEFRHWIMWTFGSVLLYSMISLRDQFPNAWIAYYLGSFGAAGMIIAATRWELIQNRLSALQRFFRFDISYGLYILHFPIMLWIRELAGEPVTYSSAPFLFAACLILTILLSVLLMFLVERPAISLGKRLTSDRNNRKS
jgi:peptidoglycan/LPS O-acetylase OafA/YrhL